ncbi:PRC-barrel domain-containing protein [Methanocaldococcus sp.]
MDRIPWNLLDGKRVIGNLGSIIGDVTNVVFDEKDGRILFFEIEPVEGSILDIEEGKKVLIPFKLVYSVRDVVVINEELLESEGIKIKKMIKTIED